MNIIDCAKQKCAALCGGECYGVALFLCCTGWERNVDKVKKCPKEIKEEKHATCH